MSVHTTQNTVATTLPAIIMSIAVNTPLNEMKEKMMESIISHSPLLTYPPPPLNNPKPKKTKNAICIANPPKYVM